MFNTLAANSRFAYLTNIEQSLCVGDVTNAAAQLSAPTPALVGTGVSTDSATGVNVADDYNSNNIVSNYMSFYSVYLDYMKDSMSSADSANLIYMAGLCPSRYGAAVYRARSLYTVVFSQLNVWNDDSCAAADTVGPISSRPVNSDSTTLSKGLGQRYDLFPNPNDGIMILTQMAADNQPIMTEVTDVVGRSVYKNSITFADGSYRLDVGNLVPGVYLMQLTDVKGRKFMFKFVKE